MIRSPQWELLPAQVAKAQPVKGKHTILAGPADPQEWNHLYPQLCAKAHVQLDPP